MKLLSIDVGIKNLSYCYTEINGSLLEDIRIIKWNNISITEKNCNKLGINECIESMMQAMKNEFDNIEIDNVLIENQPGNINKTMKSLSIVIYSYFVFNNIKVEFVHAFNKLKTQKCKELLSSHQYNIKKYSDRKKIAIDVVKYYVINYFPDYVDIFVKKAKRGQSFKKDDLADALLYIIYYVECVKK